MQRRRKLFLFLLILSLFLLVLSSCQKETKHKEYYTLEEVAKDKLTIAAGTDLVASGGLKEKFPNATFQGLSEGILIVQSVQNGKVDALILGESYLKAYMRELNATDLRIIDEPVLVYDVSLALNDKSVIPNYQQKVDAALDAMKADGTLEDIRRRWVDEGQDTPPMVEMPENPDYVLKAVTFGMSRPYTFVINDTLMGRDIELAMEVARRNNWGLEWETADFPSMLMGLAMGKYDLIASNLYRTSAREENVTYSQPYAQDITRMMVKTYEDQSLREYQSLEELKASFNTSILFMSDLLTNKAYTSQFPNSTFYPAQGVLVDVVAIQNGKYDAYLMGEGYLQEYIRELKAKDIKILEEPFAEFPVCLGLCKTTAIPNYQEKINATIQEMLEDGTVKDIHRRWVEEGQEAYPAIKMPENPDYVLKVGTFGLTKPYTFVTAEGIVGEDIELAMEVARRNNWGLEWETADYSGLLMGLSIGKYDMVSAHLYETAERSEGIVFSAPFYQDPIKALVRTNTGIGGQKEKTNLLETFRNSFNKNFLQENRWKSLLKGYGVTLLITVLSFLLANVMGAIFCYLGMSKNKFNRTLATSYSHLMQGLPILVILLILYYVIFGKSRINGIWVSIIGLGVTNGASMAGTFQGGIEAVNKGQKEAALALGMTKMQAFFGIILPQAIRSMISGYFGQLIGLLKLTSIVGYIAVIDLTKASDLIRSATYSAFFPLLSVALIYYLTIDILLWALKLVQKRLAPKRIKAEKE